MTRSKSRAAVAAAAALAAGVSAAHAGPISFTSSFAAPNYNSVASANASSPSPLGYSADGSTFMLTNGIGTEATSGFYAIPADVTQFQASFTFQSTTGADGAVFVMQNSPTAPTAFLGQPGGGLGYQYSSSATAPFTATTTSAGLMLNIYSGYTRGTNFSTNGIVPSSFTNANSEIGYNTDPIRVTMYYSGNNVTASFVDLTTKATYVRNYGTYSIPTVVGGNTAYVGFTAATGGITATQNVSNFNYTATSGYNYTPLALTGYNQDVIVDAAAPVGNVSSYVTATMDAGTAKTGATFFETGYNGSTAGLPHPGTFASQGDTRHSFLMQPSAGSNALQLNLAASTGTFTLVTPLIASSLSFLYADGNGSAPFTVTVTHVDGSTETVSSVAASDWFSGGPTAYTANGRISNLTTGAFDSIASGNPRLYQADVFLTDTVDPIASITLAYNGTGAGTQMTFFGISAAAPVPEPTTVGLIGLGVAGLFGRRKR